jgi:alpha-beta hydrolase superfamily lysophospholipase
MLQYKNILILSVFILSSLRNSEKKNYELIFNNNNDKIKLVIDNMNLNNDYFKFSNSNLQIINYLIYEFSFTIVNLFNKCYLCNIKNTYEINIDKNTNIYLEIFNTVSDNDKIILLNHGLTDTTASLMLKKIKYYNNEGYDIGIFWRRGHYNNITNNLIISDSSEDLDKIIINLVDNKNYKNIYLDGVSAGSLTVYKYLIGNYEYKKYIKGAILKSPSFNILEDLKELNKFYNNYLKKQILYLADRIKNNNYNINENMSLIDILINIISVNQGKDKDYIIEQNEFNIDFNLYKNNKIPLLILIAEDDPITKYDNINNLKNIVNYSKNMVLLITKTGHHAIWHSRNNDKDSLSQLIVNFFKNL